MPRPIKINETYEQVSHWSKIFMYSQPSWNNIGPIVEIIKNLNKNSIISYKYGKGQHTIRTYGTQYFHRVIGCDFKKESDYMDNIVNGLVKFIFTFSDTSDSFIKNLISVAKTYKIVLISYSNIDEYYYFYNYAIDDRVPMKIKDPLKVINSMNELNDYISFKEVVNIFPEYKFDLIPEDINITSPLLERCLKILKESNNNEVIKKDKKKIQLIDLNQSNSENNINSENIKSPVSHVLSPFKDTKKQNEKPKMLLSQFFKKKI